MYLQEIKLQRGQLPDEGQRQGVAGLGPKGKGWPSSAAEARGAGGAAQQRAPSLPVYFGVMCGVRELPAAPPAWLRSEEGGRGGARSFPWPHRPARGEPGEPLDRGGHAAGCVQRSTRTSGKPSPVPAGAPSRSLLPQIPPRAHCGDRQPGCRPHFPSPRDTPRETCARQGAGIPPGLAA